ncbi:hypothetical protein BH09SUM1_BH09SUM1_18970 [soil metagenome]
MHSRVNKEVVEQKMRDLFKIVDPRALPAENRRLWLVPTEEVVDPNDAIDLGSGMSLLISVWYPQARSHPLTPDMSALEYASFQETVRTYGVLQAVMLIADGDVLDGTHRLKSVCELRQQGVDVKIPPALFVEMKDKKDESTLVILLNATRRMLTLKARTEMARKLIREGHNGTDRRIGELMGLHGETVGNIRRTLTRQGEVPETGSRVDRRGRKHTVAKEGEASRQDRPKRVRAQGAASHKARSAADEVEDDVVHDAAMELLNSPAAEPSEGIAVQEQQSGEDPAEPSSPEDLRDLAVKAVSPAAADTMKEFLLGAVSKWWEAHGYFPVTMTKVLELGAVDESIVGKDGPRILACIVTALGGRTVSGYRITNFSVVGTAKTVYVLSPAGWSKHGPLAK